MSENYGHKQINFGFIMVCLAFSIPILFLFYFMVSFKNANILFIEDELAGTKKIEELLQSYGNKTNFDVTEKVREIGNESKLILDSDLDSYYIMHTVIISLPRLHSFYQEYLNPKLSEEEKKALQILIEENIHEVSADIEVALEKDKFFHGINDYLQSSEYLGRYHASIEVFKKGLTEKGRPLVLSQIINFWMTNLRTLKGILEQRSGQLVQERNNAVGITLGLWIFSFFLVFYFARQVLRRQKKLYEKIESQNLKLTASSKMSALGEMAGGIAHEINTPLAVIQMRTEQLLSDLGEEVEGEIDKAAQIEALSIIDQTVNRISKIVMGLRCFARDGSKDPMVKCSISKVVNDTFSLCKERFVNHGIRLEYLCKNDFEIECRPVELSQVLLNLLNNSYDAVKDFPEKWVVLELSKLDEKVCLSVTDSGKGIPSALQAKIMQPFFTTKEVGLGTGLGLSISQGLITSQNGQLVLDTQSKNTRFVISFQI